MATKIRLQRHGRKGYAFYSIVIADVRAPRDGKFTEKIGTYNPNTNPATVDLKFDRALYWVEVGAQPTDTVRNILSKEGVYMMKHLRGGVKKGAFDEATAQAKFEAWKSDKQKGLEAFEAKKAADKKAAAEARLQAEKKVNVQRRKLPRLPQRLKSKLLKTLLMLPQRKQPKHLLKHKQTYFYYFFQTTRGGQPAKEGRFLCYECPQQMPN